MSHHLHSQKTKEYGIVNVVMGYEPSGGHIFCTVKQETTDRPLYNSFDDDEGGTHQLDVEYYRAILALLGLAVPESMFREVERDQALRVESRYFVHD